MPDTETLLSVIVIALCFWAFLVVFGLGKMEDKCLLYSL